MSITAVCVKIRLCCMNPPLQAWAAKKSGGRYKFEWRNVTNTFRLMTKVDALTNQHKPKFDLFPTSATIHMWRISAAWITEKRHAGVM